MFMHKLQEIQPTMALRQYRKWRSDGRSADVANQNHGGHYTRVQTWKARKQDCLHRVVHHFITAFTYYNYGYTECYDKLYRVV